MADNVEITLKPVPVTPDSTPSIDYDKLTDDQKLIANKIFDEAERQGVDPDLMLSLAHIENRFKTGPSPKGALGPMQLMPGTAKDLGVDPNNIDQNITGGVTYFKIMLDKYKDPYIAGIAYNAGPGVADKFLETDDLSGLDIETLDYIDQLDRLYKPKGADVDVDNVPVIQPLPEEKAGFERDAMAEAAGAGAGATAGLASGAYTEAKIKQAETGEKATQRQVASAEKRIAAGETRVAAKEGEHTGRLKIQTTATESSVKEAARLREAQLAAEKRLAKATDNARRYGVLEEVVKTTPGGVTQQGGLGSGAMRHANVMGEVHEANVVRKGTETAGPGYSQKSRLIVPDKYAGASVYNQEQIAAQKELAAADAEHQRLIKAADKAEGVAQKEADRLRNLTERGPSGKTAAQASLDIAKQDYANAAAKKVPGVGTNIVRYISKIPGMSMLPGAGAGLDLVEAGERFKQGDYPGAAISGVGALGGALSMIPPIGPVGAGLKVIGGLTSLAAPALNYYRDSREPEQTPGYAAGGKVVAILEEAAKKFHPTVRGRERVAFPKVYRDPRVIVAESSARVPEESPFLSQLFGVSRQDLDAMTREMPHNLAAPYYKATRPPEYLPGLEGKANTQRVQDILSIAENDPRFAGSYGWYQSEPLRQRFIQLNENGAKDFDRFSQLGAALSPSTAVPKEIERSSVAYLMDKQGRLSDFLDPRNMPKGYGHAYHTTAHNAGVRNILERGDFRPEQLKMAPKTRVYYGSRTGENLDVPTADAHFVRGIGLADLRPATKADDFGSSISATELDPVTQWYRGDVASPIGMRASPAQALQWNAMGTSTGVETELGVPFLELLSRRIGDVAAKEGVSPLKVRDEFITGKRHLAEGGVVKGYAKGGDEGADMDAVAEYYGNRLDASNSDMTQPVISDKGNVVHNMVAQRNKLTDKYLGSAGRFASRGLEGLRTALDSSPAFDKSVLYPEAANLKVGSDLLIGQLPETLYDYTTSGQPGFVRGGKWVPSPATGGMMYENVYGDINALDFLNLLGIEAPIAAGAKTVYKVAKPLARSATEHAVSGINRANRALRTPEPLMMNVETSTANRSDDAAETMRRFKEVAAEAKFGRRDLGPAMQSEYPIGQGVWTGEKGAAQFHPNVMANIDDFSPEEINHMRQLLDQYGIGAGRFRPDLIAQPSRANAVQILDADPEWIKNIGQHYAQSNLPAVVFAQPNNRAMLFNMNSDLPKDLSVLLDAPQLAGKKVRYGEANIPTDRNYINSVESARVTGTKKAPKKKAK